MIRALLVASLLVLASPALADEYDYLGSAPDQATLAADPTWSQFWIAPSADGPGGFRADECIAVQVLDTTNLDANGNPTPLSGYFEWCAKPVKDAALIADPATVLTADYDLWAQNNPAFIVSTPLTQVQMDNYLISPQMARGKAYPFGAAP